ncbi:TIGR02391 family protein [Georgenia yuyongxinii]|uniref:TIGR02391 family protein n=1 Tax=Georgenia yuyongxinii TaxID=2589797 RepID=A0A5B8C8V6_9MICO|nr:TIGR02391 family protein [Georgenia yuyongxinii]
MTGVDYWKTPIRLAVRLGSELAEYASPTFENDEPPAEQVPTLHPGGELLPDFDNRITDTDLRQATRSRFVSQHYADAVEAAVKTLNECVRSLSGRHEDGDGLMTVVFSPSNPILRINSGRTKSDESAQRGHMQLCQGVIGAWRNPRAHRLLDDAPERTLMMLEVINDLIGVTKSAKRTRRRKTA